MAYHHTLNANSMHHKIATVIACCCPANGRRHACPFYTWPKQWQPRQQNISAAVGPTGSGSGSAHIRVLRKSLYYELLKSAYSGSLVQTWTYSQVSYLSFSKSIAMQVAQGQPASSSSAVSIMLAEIVAEQQALRQVERMCKTLADS